MKKTGKILLPLIVLVLAGFGMVILFATRPKAEPVDRVVPVPLVRAAPVVFGRQFLVVAGQGMVRPRSEVQLVPEVSGRVRFVADSLAAGSAFVAGDELLRIDPRDYELALRRAEAEVAQARVAVEREEAEADLARSEWKSLGRGRPSSLALREPQLAEAQARLAAARAVRDQSRLALERTSLRAPFDGRVASERVAIGEFVGPGVSLGRIYATDSVEIRVPVADAELAFLTDPMVSAGSVPARATVYAELGGARREWPGRLIRTEAEIDPATRLISLVVEVTKPFGSDAEPVAFPLMPGAFVEVRIQGRTLDDVFQLPRVAMRGPDTAYVVDSDSVLRTRRVEVLRRESDRVLVSSGIEPGDQALLSVLEIAVDGMPVRVEEQPASGKTAAGGNS